MNSHLHFIQDIMPRLAESVDEILNDKKYQGVDLKPGWYVDSERPSVDEEGDSVIITSWKKKKAEDVWIQAATLCDDLAKSLQQRMEKGCLPIHHLLQEALNFQGWFVVHTMDYEYSL